MVKILSTSLDNMFRNSEQLRDSSRFLMKADDPPLEELDPAILSCGLPAIILSEVQPMYAPPIRYTIDQLLSLRKSALCSRRPLAADDPKIASFAIWINPSQPNRRGKPQAGNSRKDDKDKGACDSTGKGPTQERDDKQKHPARHENNGFIGPRFRQNYEFSNRNHHVIVRSYRGEGDNYQMQNTMVENEPEWVSAGPTSRLDTIELRGFDDDLSNHDGSSVSQSWGKANSGDAKNSSRNSSGKHTSFYDDLHHYEHVVNPKRNDIFLKPHDSSGRENDVESVTTSNTGSPPPARSTPTKHMTDCNNLADDTQKHNSVNVNNFEKFMKFDSLLGSDSAPRTSAQSGSRSSKWFRHGNNQSADSNYDRRQHSFNMTQDSFSGSGNYNRYPFDRSFPQQYQSRFSSSYNNSHADSQNYPPQADPNSAYRRVMDMIVQSRANNHNQTAQEQYMLQMLNKTQQSEILRRMLIKNTVDSGSGSNQQQQASQPPRIPTQLELQLHTQSIMQNALLRKKLQDQHRMVLEQNSNLSAMATAPNTAEPNAEVQQFVKSVSPNFQRTLSVLNQTATAGAGQYRPFNQSFPGANPAANNPLFIGGSNQLDLSASLRQMLLPQQQQQGPRPFGNRRRSGKKSVTWKNPI